jgi:hypothetical protein
MNGEIRLSAFRTVSPACVRPQFELRFKDREEIEQPFFYGAAPVKLKAIAGGYHNRLLKGGIYAGFLIGVTYRKGGA